MFFFIVSMSSTINQNKKEIHMHPAYSMNFPPFFYQLRVNKTDPFSQ